VVFGVIAKMRKGTLAVFFWFGYVMRHVYFVMGVFGVGAMRLMGRRFFYVLLCMAGFIVLGWKMWGVPYQHPIKIFDNDLLSGMAVLCRFYLFRIDLKVFFLWSLYLRPLWI